MKFARYVFLTIFVVSFVVVPATLKVYNQTDQPDSESGRLLSSHYIRVVCNGLGLLSVFLFLILTAADRLRTKHAMTKLPEDIINRGTTGAEKEPHETVSIQKEPFILRTATLYLIAILIAAGIIFFYAFSFLWKK